MGMVLVSGALAQEEDEGISIEYSDADLAAVDKIKEAGALVLEVAQNDNRLNVAFHLTTAEVGNEQVSLSLIHI